MNLEITSLWELVSGTEATQYGIKVFNPQEWICYTKLDLQVGRESCKSCQSCLKLLL